MKPQRPSLDTSFGTLSLERTSTTTTATSAILTATPALTAATSSSSTLLAPGEEVGRGRADSVASHSSSSAFETPPEGHSPRHPLFPVASTTTNTTTSTSTDQQQHPTSSFSSSTNPGPPLPQKTTRTSTPPPRKAPSSSSESTDDSTPKPTSTLTSLHNRNASVGSPPLYEFVKAKYDYVPDHPSGLPFYAGQLIQVHYKDASGWWDGEVSNIRGWFPSNYLFQNSSKFIRASTHTTPRHAHRSRNASIDIVTASDRSQAPLRSLNTTTTIPRRNTSPTRLATTTVQTNGRAMMTTTTGTAAAAVGRHNIVNGAAATATAASSAAATLLAERRKLSLATTNEQHERESTHSNAATAATSQVSPSSRPAYGTLPRSTSTQSFINPFSPTMTMQGGAQSYAVRGTTTSLHRSNLSHSQTPMSPGGGTPSQPQSQDWMSLSEEDLMVLQRNLTRPSPLSGLRHPDPTSRPFEPELVARFNQLVEQHEMDEDGSVFDAEGPILFLNMIHRALWMLENSVVATAAASSSSSASGHGIDNGSMGEHGKLEGGGGGMAGNSELENGVLPPFVARDYLVPAMACVIGTVRSVLSASDCLGRTTANLTKHPVLVGHRKTVLGEVARLVNQTKLIGDRSSEEEPFSPVDDMSRRASEATNSISSHVSGGDKTSLQAAIEAFTDFEIRRELERCQAVYDAMRRFVSTAVECGVEMGGPAPDVLRLFDLGDPEDETTYDSEMDAMTGEGSWEEDHGFRFHVAQGSNTDSEDAHGRPLSRSDMTKYAIRARRFANSRPGHNRGRTGSIVSVTSGYNSGSGHGPRGSTSGGSRSSGESVRSRPFQPLIQPTSPPQPQPQPRPPRAAAPTPKLLERKPSVVTSPLSRTPSITTHLTRLRNGTNAVAPMSKVESALAAAAVLRAAKSLSDLKAKYRREPTESAEPVPIRRLQRGDDDLPPEIKAARRARVIHAEFDSRASTNESFTPRTTKSSISSVSSAESAGSNHSSSQSHSSVSSPIPNFPSGPCTVVQVLQALRTTQDHILHSTAAFIGAAQYHSRASHPASKGYLVALTREVVDFVRRLLVIADAILGNSTVRAGRAREVDMALVYKTRLYVEMNRVVDAVRGLTAIRNDDESDAGSSAHGDADGDDEEKGIALKRAHLANKCAGDLVLALKLCLSFRMSKNAGLTGEGGLMIDIPEELSQIGTTRTSTDSQPHFIIPPRKTFTTIPASSSTTTTATTPSTTQKSPEIQTSSPRTNERITRTYSRLDRVNGGAVAEDTVPSAISTRARALTTRNPQLSQVGQAGLHKKAISMMGMNSVYRTGAVEARTVQERLRALREERPVQFRQSQSTQFTDDEIPVSFEIGSRDEESDRERRPLLMSEPDDSDSREGAVQVDPDEPLLEYRRDIRDSRGAESTRKPKPIRRSIDEVRLSLERGLTKRPSMNLLEPASPLDGNEEIVDSEDEIIEEEEEPTESPTAAQETPETTTVAPQSDQPPRPAHAPPPKPAHHDGFVVSSNGNIVFNSAGVVVGATLQALVDRITPADVLCDQQLASYFLLTFRLFATPEQLVNAIIYRFKNPMDGTPMPDSAEPMPSSMSVSDDQRNKTSDIIHARVINLIKEWTRAHWYPARDVEALPKLIEFFKELASGASPKFTSTGKRMLTSLEELMAKPKLDTKAAPFADTLDRMRSAGRLRDQQQALNAAAANSALAPTTPISANPSSDAAPAPELSRSLLNKLKAKQFASLSPTDFSPVEMARQLTLLECRLYCSVPPEEVLEIGMSGKKTPNVKALSTLSTAITGWVTDLVLKEGLDVKKRVAIIKFFLKVGKECLNLSNFSTPRSIMAALGSTPVSRLRSVWAGISQKHRAVFQEMHDLQDYSRNSARYRERLRRTVAPAVPFLGLILTDVTFTREGNGAHRPSPADPNKMLINFNRYNRLAKILGDMIRLQQPYSLKEIPEVQQYFDFVLDPSRMTADEEVLHRRSRLIEPRVEDDSKQAKGSDLFGWASNFGSVRGNPVGTL